MIHNEWSFSLSKILLTILVWKKFCFRNFKLFLGLERFGPVARPFAKLSCVVCSSSRRQYHSWAEQLWEALLPVGEYWLSQPKRYQSNFMGHSIFTLSTVELYCQLPSTFDPSFASPGSSLSHPGINSTAQHGWKLHVETPWKVCASLLCWNQISIFFSCLDMSRDLTMTPRKITYAGDQEKVLVEHFRSVTEIDTEQIIIDALEATKKEIEAETIDSILAPFDFDAPNNNFDALVAEIDRLALALVAKHTENKMSAHKLRASDSGPLLRCLSQLEEAVDMKKSEAPSTFLKELLQVGSQYHFKTIDALPTQAVIKRKFKLLITRSCSINGEWIRQHLTNFVDMICPKKLGLSLHRSLRGKIRTL